MRKLTLNGNLLNGFALAVILSGCQNEELATQQTPTDITAENRNAKTIFTPQLLKEGPNELEYYGDYDTNIRPIRMHSAQPANTFPFSESSKQIFRHMSHLNRFPGTERHFREIA